MRTAMNASLGKRYKCVNCTCKYYDLHQPEPTCPRCGAAPDGIGPTAGAVISLEEFRATQRGAAPTVLPDATEAAADAFKELFDTP